MLPNSKSKLQYSYLHKNILILTQDGITWSLVTSLEPQTSFLQTFASLSWSGMMNVLVVPSTLSSRGTEKEKPQTLLVC